MHDRLEAVPAIGQFEALHRHDIPLRRQLQTGQSLAEVDRARRLPGDGVGFKLADRIFDLGEKRERAHSGITLQSAGQAPA